MYHGSNLPLKYTVRLWYLQGRPYLLAGKNNHVSDTACTLAKEIFGVNYSYDSSLFCLQTIFQQNLTRSSNNVRNIIDLPICITFYANFVEMPTKVSAK